MFTLVIPDAELFDEVNSEFVTVKGGTIQLEHSLVSISKWESKWNKAFLGKEQKTPEEIMDYIKCMTITKNVSDKIYRNITQVQIEEIVHYIEAPMTATWFSDDKNQSQRNTETVTSELIYYWMISLQIPVEFQRWHLNRLLTLIRVCNVKNTPPKKMSQKEIMNRNRSLNEARKASMHTRG